MLGAVPARAAVSITATTAAGGVSVVGNVITTGNVNGLGVGTPTAGFTVITFPNTGVLYSTPINLNVTLSGGDVNHSVTITAQTTTDFTHTALLNHYVCLPGACGASGNFTAIPTASTVAAINPTVVNTTATFTPNMALFVANTNGGGVFTGADAGRITYTLTANGKTATVVVRTNSINIQTAVSLQLATGILGPGTPCTIGAGGGGDFNMSFGNINGLGIGIPTCGAVASTNSTSATYATSYQLTPSFSDFASATGTVSMTTAGFVHSGTLTLQEGATTGSLAGLPASGTTHSVSVASSASTGSSINRFLAVVVKNSNGGGSFPGTAAASGADSAIVTFTLTVP